MKRPILTALSSIILQCAVAGASACSVTATGMNFPPINPISGNAYNGTATITVTCPVTTNFSVSLSPGAGAYGQRVMQAGGNTLRYSLFLDSAMTQLWGDGTAGTGVWNGTAGSAGVSHTVYGHVPYQPSAVPGTYTDAITVTVIY